MSSVNNYLIFVKKVVRYLYHRLILSFKEKRYDGRLKYLFETHNSNTLIIVFSGMATRKPKYMYMRTLKDVMVDKLFILDDFGYKGSYYWFENGADKPLRLTSGLINTILKSGKYKYVYTAGSSKGGSCAIYYGLMFNVTEVIASACQYHIGTYLTEPHNIKIFEKMKGQLDSGHFKTVLDTMIPNMIKSECNTKVHLLFSKKDPTYHKHIVDLSRDLQAKNIETIEVEAFYKDHGENGPHISQYLRQKFLV